MTSEDIVLDIKTTLMFIKSNGYLLASYYCQDDRLRYSTGVKSGSTAKGDKLKLDRISRIITQYVANCDILEQPVLKGGLQAHIDKELDKNIKGSTGFKIDWAQMIADMRSGALLKKDGNRFGERSPELYEGTMKILENYETAQYFSFSYKFTIENYRDWLKWMNKNEYSRNTIAGHVSRLSSFFSKMHEAKKHKNEVYKHSEFRYSWEESDTIALTIEEVTAIYNLQLTGAQERARDVFVFGCWVALRPEDLGRINQYKRRGDVFDVFTNKTDESVVIPVHWMADEIYTKYGGVLPVYSTPEGLNYHLSDICEGACITEMRLVAITKGGQKTAQYYRKCDLVTAYTARRTFATIMYLMKFPVKSIMKITGHKTESNFFKYIRISKEEAADMMLQNPFFKKPS